MTPRDGSPAPHKSGTVPYTCDLSTWKMEMKVQEFKVTLGLNFFETGVVSKNVGFNRWCTVYILS